MSTQTLVYSSFDRFPAQKGAATHIRAFVTALADQFPTVELVTVAGPPSAVVPAIEKTSDSDTDADPPLPLNVRHTELAAIGPSLVERVLHFRAQLRAWWGGRKPRVAHIRSIFEGYPIAKQKAAWCDKLVFEVNGLPSVELKYHYPQVADDRELMHKLVTQENECLAAADLVLTVSDVNAAYLISRGVAAEKIEVIPNGVDAQLFSYQPPRPWGDREIQLLYCGTLSSWQGVDIAIESLELFRRDLPARLTIVGFARSGQVERLRETAYRLGVEQYVEIVKPLPQLQLAQLHHQADAILVPLVPNDRNLVQGCCPLKALEAMASGSPLIASDMPVVSALARPEVDAILVRPGSAKAIKDGLLRLRNEPEATLARSAAARQRVEEFFTWNVAQIKLRNAYRRLLA